MSDAHTPEWCASKPIAAVDPALPDVWFARGPEGLRAVVDVPGMEPLTLEQIRSLIAGLTGVALQMDGQS